MFTSRFRWLVSLLLLSIAAPAAAHDPWESNALSLHPSSPNHIALRTNRGVLLSGDGGATWRFVCRLAFNNFIPVPAVTAGDDMLLGGFRGLSTIETDGCNDTPVNSALTGRWVADLQHDPVVTNGMYAATASGVEDNGIFHSTDNGATWTALGALVPNVFFKQVRVTPDGSRIFVAAAEFIEATESEPERVDYTLRYTDDRGQTWTTFPFAMASDDYEMILLDVDPNDPDRVFAGVHVCREGQRCFNATQGQRLDSVMVSEDRGATWSTVIQVREIASFEINDEYLWVGDWWGGLWRADRNGNNATRLHEFLKAGCLEATTDGLYVCGTDLLGFMLARSDDNGETLTPVAGSFNVVGGPVCGPSDIDGGVDPVAACRNEWRDLCNESFIDEPVPPLECAGFITPRMDAGTGTAPVARGGGCSCHTTGTSGTTPTGWSLAWWLWSLAPLALIIRRQRHPTRCTVSPRFPSP